MQVIIENNQFYIEDFYKPEFFAGSVVDGIKDLRNAHALIIKEYRQAMKNDGQLVGMERISITEHIEAAVRSSIRFVLMLSSLYGQVGVSTAPDVPEAELRESEARPTDAAMEEGAPNNTAAVRPARPLPEGPAARIIDMSDEIKGTDIKLTVMERKYSLRGRFISADVGDNTEFLKSLSHVVELLGRTAEFTSRFTGDSQLTDEEFLILNREIFSTIYRLLVLKQNIETLRINK